MLMLSLPRKSVVRITDSSDMTSAGYSGHKARNESPVSLLAHLSQRLTR